MPSIQTFLEAAFKAETLPTTDSWDSLISTLLAIFQSVLNYIAAGFHQFSDWAQKPDTQILFVTWFIIFWVVLLIPLCLGFGPVGVLAGSLAAGFQSWMYGGFTPAGGVFAVLTSIGMLGIFAPIPIAAASVIATLMTIIIAGVNRDIHVVNY